MFFVFSGITVFYVLTKYSKYRGPCLLDLRLINSFAYGLKISWFRFVRIPTYGKKNSSIKLDTPVVNGVI